MDPAPGLSGVWVESGFHALETTVDTQELDIEKKWLILARLDPGKFTLFYDKYCDGIYRFCLRRVVDHDLAEDLTSSTFLQAQRKLWQFRWQGVTMGAWFYRIALNVVRKHLRAAAHDAHVNTDDISVVDTRLDPLALVV